MEARQLISILTLNRAKDIFKHFSSSQEVAGEHFFSRSFSVFMKVMEEKKFSAAAVKLQLTQSSISQTIAGLERSLGVDLFLSLIHI